MASSDGPLGRIYLSWRGRGWGASSYPDLACSQVLSFPSSNRDTISSRESGYLTLVVQWSVKKWLGCGCILMVQATGFMGEWKERGIKSDYGIIAWTITNMGGKRLRAGKSRFGGKESTSDIDIRLKHITT